MIEKYVSVFNQVNAMNKTISHYLYTFFIGLFFLVSCKDDENSSTTRTLQISSQGENIYSVTLEAIAHDTTFKIESTSDWTYQLDFLGDEKDWITIEPLEEAVRAQCQKNTTLHERKARLLLKNEENLEFTFNITQKSGEPHIQVTIGKRLNLSSIAGDTTIAVHASKGWTASIVSGNNNIVSHIQKLADDTKLKVTYTANTTSVQRNALMQISVADLTYDIEVVQSPRTFTVSPSTLAFSCKFTVRKQVTVAPSGLKWSVHNPVDWIDVRYILPDNILIAVADNNLSTSRSATLTVTVGHSKQTITINQAVGCPGGPPTLSISDVQVAGSSTDFYFIGHLTNWCFGNTDYNGDNLTATASESWIRPHIPSRGRICVKLDINPTINDRTAVLTFQLNGTESFSTEMLTKTFTVKQGGAEFTVDGSILLTPFRIPAADSGTRNFKLVARNMRTIRAIELGGSGAVSWADVSYNQGTKMLTVTYRSSVGATDSNRPLRIYLFIGSVPRGAFHLIRRY